MHYRTPTEFIMPSHVSRIESSGRTAEPQGTGMLSRVPFEHADRVLERKEGSTCRVLLHSVFFKLVSQAFRDQRCYHGHITKYTL